MMISSAFFFLPIWTPTTKIHTWLLVRLSATGCYENRQISVRKNYSNATRGRQALKSLISSGVWRFLILIFTGRKENKIGSEKRQNHQKSKSEYFYRIERTLENTGFSRVLLAERKGFEPLCAFAQTDFESAPLWPLRYLSVYVHPRKRGKQSLFNFLENPLDKSVRKIINRAKTQQNQGFSAVFGGTTTQMRTWFRVRLVMTTSIRFRVTEHYV